MRVRTVALLALSSALSLGALAEAEAPRASQPVLAAQASALPAVPVPVPPFPVPAPPSPAPGPAVDGPLDLQAQAAADALIATLSAEPLPELVAPGPTPSRTAPRASILPIPEPPQEPARRRRFRLSPDDPAGEPARIIAQRVARFRNFRAEVPGAVWGSDEAARFSVRPQQKCLDELARLGIRAHLLERPLTTPVPTPVVLDGPIGGVAFVSLHADRQVEVSCELAARLPVLARVLRKQGVRAVGVNSSYRDMPKVSFHSFGLALDIAAFRTRDRTLSVAKHFEVTADARTCEGSPSTAEGKALLAIACAIADSHAFSSVLTPNYNEGHRDHFHVDVRPDDARLFVR